VSVATPRGGGRSGPLNALDRFDPNDRYNLWSGLIGGFFLQLSYFGTDQSQVGRYLTGSSVAQSRMGLIANGFLKIPMQFAILALGVLVFVFYLFVTPPLFFQPEARERMASGPAGTQGAGARPAAGPTRSAARRLGGGLAAAAGTAATRRGGGAAQLLAAQGRLTATRGEAVALIKQPAPDAPTNDTNYVFPPFVLAPCRPAPSGWSSAAILAADELATAGGTSPR
jgi:hypothetical protein